MRTDITTFEIEPGYVLKFNPAPYIILRVGMTVDKKPIIHPNVVASSSRVFEFKHYRSNGGKFWTSKAGNEYYFVVPKEKIEILPEKGYSYPKVEIGGKLVVLNCSGGTTGDGGWEDWIGPVASTSINLVDFLISAIADNSLTVAECNQRGITNVIRENEDERLRTIWLNLASEAVIRKVINKSPIGKKLITFNEPETVYLIQSRYGRKQCYVCTEFGFSSRFRVTYKAIDWMATAAANGMEDLVPQLRHWNKIGG